jgi:hypothetical protein
MGVLGTILGGLDLGAVTGIIDKTVIDKDLRARLNVEMAQLADNGAARAHEQQMGQLSVNKAEASSTSLFVAGWRPAAGWICVVGAAWAFVAAPLLEFIARLCGWDGPMPEIDVSTLMTLLLGLLGLAGYRTIERRTGVARGNLERGIPLAPDAPIMGQGRSGRGVPRLPT